MTFREHELKARLEEAPEAFAARLREAGWRRTFRGEMRDRRYDSRECRLEAEDRVLRLREWRAETPGRSDAPSRAAERASKPRLAVLAWKGPAATSEGFKVREERETEVGDADAMAGILARLGFPDVTMTIDRRVEVWEKGSVTVRVERYPRMDVLVEAEGPPEAVEAVLPELGLPREAWSSAPLTAFVSEFERRTGRTARLAEEEP